jgi:hypothetical protein
LEEEEQAADYRYRGRYLGASHIKRTRGDIDEMFRELGKKARQAFKSSLVGFLQLHEILEPYLEEQFGSSTRGRPNGVISTKLRLSAALRFFCGASIFDIQLTHGIGEASVYKSVYGVINAVNKCPHFQFNEGGGEFPNHSEQRSIASGFFQKSGAEFDKVVMAIDGMLVWTVQPSAQECSDVGVGERSFHCFRKDKFGLLLLAGCDHRCRFRWADCSHPGIASDYTAWMTSGIAQKLRDPEQQIMAPMHTIVGDNAFVETHYMAIPIPGHTLSQEEDAYNFYLSQLRITIERAFGILVHRFGILRAPLSMSIKKVPPLVMCLMRLHNYYIDTCGRCTSGGLEDDEAFIQYRAWRAESEAVFLDANRVPAALLGGGHHRRDWARRTNHHRQVVDPTTPMREMMEQVAMMGLSRPPLN